MQFERQGYFVRDKDSTADRPVFNRTIGLRDTFAKEVGGKGLTAVRRPRRLPASWFLLQSRRRAC